MSLILNVLADGATATAALFNAIFDDIRGAIFSIGNANIDTESPLSKSALADHSTLVDEVIVLVPFGTSTLTLSTAAMTTFARYKAKVQSGEIVEVISLSAYAEARTISGAVYPAIQVKKNSVILGGTSSKFLTAQVETVLENVNPTENPLGIVQDEDVFEFQLGPSDGSTTTLTVNGVTVRMTLKRDLVS